MNKNKVTKILVLLLILGLIVIQACRVGAMSISDIIGDNDTSLNALMGDGSNTQNNLFNDANSGTNPTNTPTNPTPITAPINTTNTSNTLPKTGTNENIIIGLMVICTAAGIYAFKKVKDYNM